jgi:hypothetical protein
MIVSALPILLYTPIQEVGILLSTLGGFLPNFDLLDKDKAVLNVVCHNCFPVGKQPSPSSHHAP